MQRAIPATLLRGGTSRGLYFRATDLPADDATRDAVLVAAMGSPHIRQIDGVGGAHPLTSKVAVLSTPTRPDADIDFLFLQVMLDRAEVSDGQNCGNILAGVGPWAIENGLVTPRESNTDVRIHMCNSGAMAIATVQTPDGMVEYAGDTHIDGVAGTAAAIPLEFLNIAGSSCGALLPTGNTIDEVAGLKVTCIDNGMPVVIMRAADLGKTGYESPQELEADENLVARIEGVRLAVAERMNLGNVSNKTVPKMCLLAAPCRGGVISTRTFIPRRVHETIGVLGALSVATACVIGGTVADGLAVVDSTNNMRVEHPGGYLSLAMTVSGSGTECRIGKSALLRTARKLFQGDVYIPANIWPA